MSNLADPKGSKEHVRPSQLVAFILLCALMVVGLWLVLFISFTFDTNAKTIGSAVVFPLPNPWIEESTGVILPRKGTVDVANTMDGNSVVVVTQLPFFIEHDDMLCFKTETQWIDVYFGNDYIGTFGKRDNSTLDNVFGPTWYQVPIPQGYHGQHLRMEIHGIGPVNNFRLADVFITNAQTMTLHIIWKLVPVVGFCCLMLLLAMMCLIIAAWQWLSHKPINPWSYLYLGLSLLLVVIRMATYSSLTQFFSANMGGITAISYLAMYLLPIPLLLYVDKQMHHFNWVYITLCYLNLGICIVGMVLFLIDPNHVLIMTQYVDFFYLVTSGIVLICCIIELVKYKDRYAISLVCAIVVLCLGSIGAVVSYSIGYKHLYGPHFMLGVTIFVCIIYCSLTRRFLRLMNEGVKVEVYRQLAFTDGLTGLGNRAAFEIAFAEAFGRSRQEGVSECLCVLDVNGMKVWNDTMGHQFGDRVLREVGNDLLETFGASCYRIGGDEFAILCTNILPHVMDEKINEFRGVGSRGGGGVGMVVKVAIGVSWCGPEHATPTDWFQSADDAMYAEKARMEGRTRPRAGQ